MTTTNHPIDVFISYKREDRKTAKALAEALAHRGYSVWWDVDLLPGDRFADAIMEVIKRTKVTVVLWSKLSVVSRFVRAEASVADGLDRLIPARLDACELPLPFNDLHTHDLTNWRASADETLLTPLFKALEARTGKAPTAPQQPAAAADNLHQPDREAKLWSSISEQRPQLAKKYEHYLKTYPDGTFAALARTRIANLRKLKPVNTTNYAFIALGSVATAIAAIIGLLGPLSGYLPSIAPTERKSDGQEMPPGTSTVEPEAVTTQSYKPGDRFNDCADEVWCPEMVVVPAGSFMMGSPEDEEGRRDDEGPQHRVKIAEPFAVGVHEVTRGEFAAFAAATGYDAGDRCSTLQDGFWGWRDGRNWRSPGFAQTDMHPVVCVNWHDATAYAAWLANETQEEYRLLSESEWEYAARAGTFYRRFWGDDLDNREGCVFANAADETFKETFWRAKVMNCSDGHVYTSPVGTFTENGFQLHDMLGNASEWVEDCWNDSYADTDRLDDEKAWTSGDCDRRVLRGSAWVSDLTDLRSATRVGGLSVGRSFYFGFRVARRLR